MKVRRERERERERKGTQCEQQLNAIKVKKICEFERRAQNCALWRTRFGRGNE